MQNLQKPAFARIKPAKPAARVSRTSIPRLVKHLAGLQRGYRKHPAALRGVKGMLKLAEVSQVLRKLDTIEAKEEKLEKELKKIRTERDKLAAAASKKAGKSRQIARAVLSRLDAKDFLN